MTADIAAEISRKAKLELVDEELYDVYVAIEAVAKKGKVELVTFPISSDAIVALELAGYKVETTTTSELFISWAHKVNTNA